MSDVTRILNAIERGDAGATDELLPLVYEELRVLAAQKLSHEPPGQTLQATALVHEAYLRLVGDASQTWENRGRFFAAAAEAMRRILVKSARRRRRPKHGGQRLRMDLDKTDPAKRNPLASDFVALRDWRAHLERHAPATSEDPGACRSPAIRACIFTSPAEPGQGTCPGNRAHLCSVCP